MAADHGTEENPSISDYLLSEIKSAIQRPPTNEEALDEWAKEVTKNVLSKLNRRNRESIVDVVGIVFRIIVFVYGLLLCLFSSAAGVALVAFGTAFIPSACRVYVQSFRYKKC